METVNGVTDVDKGGPPPPSPLTGCYLLIVVGEPHSEQHKDIILQRIAKGLLSWDLNDCLVDLEKELAIITEQALEGEEARYGERLIQFASENLVTEILIHPVVSTLAQCMRNLLSSFTRHRHIIHAGYTFASNGSWALQDGTFSSADFSEAFQELEVQRVIRAYENGISLDLHCSPEGDWSRLPKEHFSKACKVRVNPTDVLTTGSPSITEFINYISPFLLPTSLESLLESSDVVGNIRFSRPTLYVFPGGQGDAALFGINGFNMLLDGGFSRKACFWDFVRHLDRLDAVLMTRLNNSNVGGISSVLRRKKQDAVYPQIGHFFCNIQERKALLSPDGDKDKDPLLINLMEEGHEIISNLRHLNLNPQVCYRDSEPINLYHKVGHGTLDMYVLSPAKDSKEVREFLQKWNQSDQKLFANSKSSREFSFPIQNLISIAALLVWQPANPNDTITRILFPGSSPQRKIFEGLDRLKNLEFIKHPVCTDKSLVPSSLVKKAAKDSIIEKVISKEKVPVEKKENKIIENNLSQNGEVKEKIVKKSDSTESERSMRTKKTEDKIIENGEKPKGKPKPSKVRSEAQQKRKTMEKKSSPTTPKKTVENGEPKKPTKPSPIGTPAKSTKDANNRKVIESKTRSAKPPPAEPKPKVERKPISRRPKGAMKAPISPVKKLVNGVQKPDTISKKGKLDKEGTTDSSTVSTPSADQESLLKKDISKLTPEEIQQMKAQELADLKEEQEAVKEIEAVFRKGEAEPEKDENLRKVQDISIDEDKLEKEEYLIIEKEEIDHDSLDEKETKEDETQKLARDSEESEKQRKLSAEEKAIEKQQDIEEQVNDIVHEAEDIVKAKEDTAEESKETVITSPEEKLDISSTDKKTTDKEIEEEVKDIVESQPDEKVSANIKSGDTTTAPTLPEDERIPLDEIKEDSGQIIEEKHVKEETKEKEVPVIQLPPKTFETISKVPGVVGIRLDKQSHIRDIVKTPDEVADLPVHEEVDYEYTHELKAEPKTNEIVEEKKDDKVQEFIRESEEAVGYIKEQAKEIEQEKDKDEVMQEQLKDIIDDVNKTTVMHEELKILTNDIQESEVALKKDSEKPVELKETTSPADGEHDILDESKKLAEELQHKDLIDEKQETDKDLSKEEEKHIESQQLQSEDILEKAELETKEKLDVKEKDKEETKEEKIEEKGIIEKEETEKEQLQAKEIEAKESMQESVDLKEAVHEKEISKTDIEETEDKLEGAFEKDIIGKEEVIEKTLTEKEMEIKDESPKKTAEMKEEKVDDKEFTTVSKDKEEQKEEVEKEETDKKKEVESPKESVETKEPTKEKVDDKEVTTISKDKGEDKEKGEKEEKEVEKKELTQEEPKVKETVDKEELKKERDIEDTDEKVEPKKQESSKDIPEEPLVNGEVPEEEIEEVDAEDKPDDFKKLEKSEEKGVKKIETGTKVEEGEDTETQKLKDKPDTELEKKTDEKKVADVPSVQEVKTELIKQNEEIIKATKEGKDHLEKLDEKLQHLKEKSPEPKIEIVEPKQLEDVAKTEQSRLVKGTKDGKDHLEKLEEKLIQLKEAEERKSEIKKPVEESEDEKDQKLTGDIVEKMELGRKSPKEREEDVIKIVASVAEVLKSDAPLEEFEGKLPISTFSPYTATYTTELRETHITTVDSPIVESKVIKIEGIPPIPEEPSTASAALLDEERKIAPVHEGQPDKEDKRSNLLKESQELMMATSKMISDIKSAKGEEKTEEIDDSDESGIVHRMLVTASSEDGGEEIEICPVGTIIYSKSSESSGRSSPEKSQELSKKSSIVDTISDSLSTVKQVVELHSEKDSGIDDVKSDTDLESQDKSSPPPEPEVVKTVAKETESISPHEKSEEIISQTVSGKSSPDKDASIKSLASGKSTPDMSDFEKSKEITSSFEDLKKTDDLLKKEPGVDKEIEAEVLSKEISKAESKAQKDEAKEIDDTKGKVEEAELLPKAAAKSDETLPEVPQEEEPVKVHRKDSVIEKDTKDTLEADKDIGIAKSDETPKISQKVEEKSVKESRKDSLIEKIDQLEADKDKETTKSDEAPKICQKDEEESGKEPRKDSLIEKIEDTLKDKLDADKDKETAKSDEALPEVPQKEEPVKEHRKDSLTEKIEDTDKGKETTKSVEGPSEVIQKDEEESVKDHRKDSIIEKIEDTIKDQLEAVSDFTKSLFSKGEKEAESVTTDLEEKVIEKKEEAKEVIREAIEKADKTAEDLKVTEESYIEKIEDKIKETFEAISVTLPSFLDHGDKKLEDSSTAVAHAADEFAAEKAVKKPVGKLEEHLEDKDKTVSDAKQEDKEETTKDATGRLAVKVDESPEKIKDTLDDKLQEAKTTDVPHTTKEKEEIDDTKSVKLDDTSKVTTESAAGISKKIETDADHIDPTTVDEKTSDTKEKSQKDTETITGISKESPPVDAKVFDSTDASKKTEHIIDDAKEETISSEVASKEKSDDITKIHTDTSADKTIKDSDETPDLKEAADKSKDSSKVTVDGLDKAADTTKIDQDLDISEIKTYSPEPASDILEKDSTEAITSTVKDKIEEPSKSTGETLDKSHIPEKDIADDKQTVTDTVTKTIDEVIKASADTLDKAPGLLEKEVKESAKDKVEEIPTVKDDISDKTSDTIEKDIIEPETQPKEDTKSVKEKSEETSKDTDEKMTTDITDASKHSKEDVKRAESDSEIEKPDKPDSSEDAPIDKTKKRRESIVEQLEEGVKSTFSALAGFGKSLFDRTEKVIEDTTSKAEHVVEDIKTTTESVVEKIQEDIKSSIATAQDVEKSVLESIDKAAKDSIVSAEIKGDKKDIDVKEDASESPKLDAAKVESDEKTGATESIAKHLDASEGHTDIQHSKSPELSGKTTPEDKDKAHPIVKESPPAEPKLPTETKEELKDFKGMDEKDIKEQKPPAEIPSQKEADKTEKKPEDIAVDAKDVVVKEDKSGIADAKPVDLLEKAPPTEIRDDHLKATDAEGKESKSPTDLSGKSTPDLKSDIKDSSSEVKHDILSDKKDEASADDKKIVGSVSSPATSGKSSPEIKIDKSEEVSELKGEKETTETLPKDTIADEKTVISSDIKDTKTDEKIEIKEDLKGSTSDKATEKDISGLKSGTKEDEQDVDKDSKSTTETKIQELQGKYSTHDLPDPKDVTKAPGDQLPEKDDDKAAKLSGASSPDLKTKDTDTRKLSISEHRDQSPSLSGKSTPEVKDLEGPSDKKDSKLSESLPVSDAKSDTLDKETKPVVDLPASQDKDRISESKDDDSEKGVSGKTTPDKKVDEEDDKVPVDLSKKDEKDVKSDSKKDTDDSSKEIKDDDLKRSALVITDATFTTTDAKPHLGQTDERESTPLSDLTRAVEDEKLLEKEEKILEKSADDLRQTFETVSGMAENMLDKSEKLPSEIETMDEKSPKKEETGLQKSAEDMSKTVIVDKSDKHPAEVETMDEKSVKKEEDKLTDHPIDMSKSLTFEECGISTDLEEIDPKLLEKEQAELKKSAESLKEAYDTVSKLSKSLSFEKCEKPEDKILQKEEKELEARAEELKDTFETLTDMSKSVVFEKCERTDGIDPKLLEKEEIAIKKSAEGLKDAYDTVTELSKSLSFDKCEKPEEKIVQKDEKKLEASAEELKDSFETVTNMLKSVVSEKYEQIDKIDPKLLEKEEIAIGKSAESLKEAYDTVAKLSKSLSFEKCEKPEDKLVQKEEKELEARAEELKDTFEKLTDMSKSVVFEKCDRTDEIDPKLLEKEEVAIKKSAEGIKDAYDTVTELSKSLSFEKCEKPEDKILQKEGKELEERAEELKETFETLTDMSKSVIFDKCESSEDKKKSLADELLEKTAEDLKETFDVVSDMSKSAIFENEHKEKSDSEKELYDEKDTVVKDIIDKVAADIDTKSISAEIKSPKDLPGGVSPELKAKTSDITDVLDTVTADIDTKSIEAEFRKSPELLVKDNKLQKSPESVTSEAAVDSTAVLEKCEKETMEKVTSEIKDSKDASAKPLKDNELKDLDSKEPLPSLEKEIIKEEVKTLDSRLGEKEILEPKSTLDIAQPEAKKLSISDVEISLADAKISKDEASAGPKDTSTKLIETERRLSSDKKSEKGDIKDDKQKTESKDTEDSCDKAKESLVSEKIPVSIAGPSTLEKTKDLSEIAELEKQQELQDTLHHEKHIPGAVTPPTVPVSPNIIESYSDDIKLTSRTETLIKEMGLRSSTPGSDDFEIVTSTQSDISSGQVSKVPLDSEKFDSDEEDQLSVTSQVAHSRDSSHYDLEEDTRISAKIDPMSMSFYGALPEDDTVEGSEKEPEPTYLYEITKAKFASGASADDQIAKKKQSEGESLMTASFIGELPSSSTSDEKKDPIESWGKPLGRPAVHTYLYEITQARTAAEVNMSAIQREEVDRLEEIRKEKINNLMERVTSPSNDEDVNLEHINQHEQAQNVMTASFYGGSHSFGDDKDPIASWGKPLGLPSPAPPNDNKGTPKKERKLPPNVTAKNKLNDDKKRAESPSKYKNKKVNPVYIDLTYVPHHGNSYYSYVDFFKRIRARYYVFSGIEPSRDVYNALLEAKQTWEDKELEVTIIPTYDTDILGYWVAENEELLTKYKIDLSPSASRCTINLQDHETSCSAYRLEF